MPDPTRKLFLHGAHRTVGVPSSAAAAAADAWDDGGIPGRQPSTAPLEVVLITGQPDRAAAALVEAVRGQLRQRLGAHVRLSVADGAQPSHGELLPERINVVVLLGDTSSIPAEGLDAAARQANVGGGVVSLATRPDRRQMGRRFQWSVLGAQLIGSAESSTVHVEIEPGAALHPAGRDVEASTWTTQLATAVLPLSADAMVLLSVRHGAERRPAAWVRQHGQGRVFGTLLGSETDLGQPAFLQLVTSAVAWAGE